MWWWIWIALILAALVITLALCWRVFLAVKALLITLGEGTAALDRARAEAEDQHREWAAAQQLADDAYEAARLEAARPVPQGLDAIARVSSVTPSPREAPDV